MKRAYALLIFGLMWLYATPCQSWGAPRKASFTIDNRLIAYEVFEGNDEGPVLILLHGASGPDVPLYRSQAQYFTTKGYTVLLLHYFDATRSSTPSIRTTRAGSKRYTNSSASAGMIPNGRSDISLS